MKNENWPALSLLMGSYLHQDWQLEGPTLEDVLDKFARIEGSEMARSAALEIGRVLEDRHTAEPLRSLLQKLGCEYALPPGNRLRPWLANVQKLLSGDKSK